MAHTTGKDFFSVPLTVRFGSYPSELQFDNEHTRRDTENQSDDYSFRDRRNTGYAAPEVPYSLQQWTDNRPPRNFLGLERLVIAPVLSDPHLDGLLGHGTSSSAYGHGAASAYVPSAAYVAGIQRSYSPETMSSQSVDSPPPASVFSMGSQGSSIDSYPPSVAPTHTTYSLVGTMPAHSMQIVMEIPDLHDQDELIPSQCFFKDILGTTCEERLRTREEFHNHMLGHFNGSPPGKALCIFCDREFENENPWSCWTEYLDHIRYQHFRNGMVIEQMRPDFVTWAYLRDTGVLLQPRYDLICELANERKPSDYGWLRPANWVSPREQARRLAEERQAEEENVVRIIERSTRRKHKEPSGRQGQSSSQRAARGSYS